MRVYCEKSVVGMNLWLNMRTSPPGDGWVTRVLCGALVLALAPVMVSTSSPAVKAMAPELQEEFCKNFTYGNPLTKEFFSPGYPR